MSLFDDCAAAYDSFLACGPCVFEHGSRAAIVSFTHGMELLKQVLKKDRI